MVDLYWFAAQADWNDRFRAIAKAGECQASDLSSLAGARINFVQTNRLDRFASLQPNLAESLPGKPVRLAVLGSSTMDHLLPAIRVGGLRRSIAITTYIPDYGSYQQELMHPGSRLFGFQPTAVLFALDQRHLLGAPRSDMTRQAADELVEVVAARVRDNWRLVRAQSKAAIIQQTILPVFPALLGGNEHRLPGSAQHLTLRRGLPNTPKLISLRVRLSSVVATENVPVTKRRNSMSQ